MTKASDIQKIFREIIKLSCPIDYYLLNEQNAPKPLDLFARLNIINLKDLSIKDNEVLEDDGQLRTDILKRLFLSLNCFGVGAFDWIENVQNKLKLQSVLEQFSGHNIAIRDVSDARRIPVFENNKYTDRGQLDITLDFVNSMYDDLGFFDKVELKGNILLNFTP